MIFSLADHIEQIKAGTKTQTRRPSDRYQVGKLYSVQPGRGKKGIPEGRIYVALKFREYKPDLSAIRKDSLAEKWMQSEAGYPISRICALEEGGYTPDEYEVLYEKMYPGWTDRYAYWFSFFTVDTLSECGVQKISNTKEREK